MKVTKHQPGMFSWADLATPDAEGSKKFYRELLELEAIDTAGGEGMVYTMLTKEGRSSCAIYEMPPDQKEMTGGRPRWTSYFTVEDADATAGRIQELGGTVQGPFDVYTSGRIGFGVDPTGAVFAIWQPREQIGAEIFGEPGALAWCELSTHDTEAAASFYTGLFGWSAMAASKRGWRGVHVVPARWPAGRGHDRDSRGVGPDAGQLVGLFRGRRPGGIAGKGEGARRQRDFYSLGGRGSGPVRVPERSARGVSDDHRDGRRDGVGGSRPAVAVSWGQAPTLRGSLSLGSRRIDGEEENRPVVYRRFLLLSP